MCAFSRLVARYRGSGYDEFLATSFQFEHFDSGNVRVDS